MILFFIKVDGAKQIICLKNQSWSTIVAFLLPKELFLFMSVLFKNGLTVCTLFLEDQIMANNSTQQLST